MTISAARIDRLAGGMSIIISMLITLGYTPDESEAIFTTAAEMTAEIGKHPDMPDDNGVAFGKQVLIRECERLGIE